MEICIENLKPNYFDEIEIVNSDIYNKDKICFKKESKYLISAESGKGKSSFLNFIYGINKNYNGVIKFNPIENINLKVSKISYVFQDLKLFEDISAIENILLKNELTNHKTTEEISKYLKKLNIWNKKDVLVKNLSFGQRQRIAIIRAICQPFDFLFLDEQFSHLDDENIKKTWTIIENEININKAGLIMVSLGNTYNIAFDKVFKL